jgi:hypothetical protein
MGQPNALVAVAVDPPLSQHDIALIRSFFEYTPKVVIVFIAYVFDYTNGFHDAANSIATVVSTRVLADIIFMGHLQSAE